MTINRYLDASKRGISALFGTLLIWYLKCLVIVHTFKARCWWEAGLFYGFCDGIPAITGCLAKRFCLRPHSPSPPQKTKPKPNPAPFTTAIQNFQTKNKRSSVYHKKDSIIKQNLCLWIVLWFCYWEQTMVSKNTTCSSAALGENKLQLRILRWSHFHFRSSHYQK